MKFLYCCFLVLQIGIKADSLSVSFINIIPSIIYNGRLIKENINQSNFILDPPLSSINIDLVLNSNESNCSRDIQLFSHDLSAKQRWALKTFDAWGKVPSGIMQGNMFWIGSVYECKHSLRGLNNSVLVQPFKTRTCTIGNGLSDIIRPIYGVCVPRSCNASDIANFVNQVIPMLYIPTKLIVDGLKKFLTAYFLGIIKIPFIKYSSNLTTDDIHCIERRPLDTTAILTIVFLSIVLILMLAATGLHIMYGQTKDLKMTSRAPIAAIEPIVPQTTITTVMDPPLPSSSLEIQAADEYDHSVSIEEIELISIPRPSIDSIAFNFINSCSLLNSYHILKSNTYPKNLACLNGIRVLSLCWIILGHTTIFAAYYSDNLLIIFNWSRKLWFQIIIQTFFSIDSFFLISGLLAAFTYFISKTENEQFSIVKFIKNHYVHYYLRYTPLYALVLLIYITLSPYLAQSGPVYPTDGIETASCRRTWWRNLLYINNFFDMRDSCMPISWFLAVNMQFHWITPLFLLIVSWKWLLGIFVCILFITVDIVSTAIIVSKNNYDYGFLSDFYSNKSSFANMSNGYLNDVYVKPWCRIAPYAVGLVIGYIFYEVYQRSNTISWDSLIPRTTIHSRHYYFKQVFVWTFAIGILALCLFGTYGDYNGHSLTRQNRIAFLTLSRLGWSIGVCTVIAACFAGHGGIINRLLSRSCFYKLSKLTYGAYLWHSLVILVDCIGRDQPMHYRVSTTFFNFICYTMISYILSFCTFLIIEIPTVQLLEFWLKRPRKMH